MDSPRSAACSGRSWPRCASRARRPRRPRSIRLPHESTGRDAPLRPGELPARPVASQSSAPQAARARFRRGSTGLPAERNGRRETQHARFPRRPRCLRNSRRLRGRSRRSTDLGKVALEKSRKAVRFEIPRQAALSPQPSPPTCRFLLTGFADMTQCNRAFEAHCLPLSSDVKQRGARRYEHQLARSKQDVHLDHLVLAVQGALNAHTLSSMALRRGLTRTQSWCSYRTQDARH